MKIGDTFSRSITVTEEMAATRAVEGVPYVYGTPSLVAFIEGTAHEALKDEFAEGQTSVGMTLELEHTSPTPIGMAVRCDVTLLSREGVLADFDAKAYDEAGLICVCKHRRAIVMRDKIVAKAQKKFSV